MANLKIKCWHCGKYAVHKVTKNDPQDYRWNGETTPIFKRIADNKDISIRQHTKHCKYCSKDFVSVEISRNHLSAMINEIIRLDQKDREFEKEIKSLRQLRSCRIKQDEQNKQKINELENQVQVLKNKLVSIAEIATPTND